MSKEKKKDDQSNDNSLNNEEIASILKEEMEFQVQTKDEETRLECLRIASQVTRPTTKEVIKSASDMFDFIKGN
jgi:hypothetical protein